MVRRERLESPMSSPVAIPQGRTLVLGWEHASQPTAEAGTEAPISSRFPRLTRNLLVRVCSLVSMMGR